MSTPQPVDSRSPGTTWLWRLVLAAAGFAAGAAAHRASELALDRLGWDTDAATVFIVICLPVLALLCFVSGVLDRRGWWMFGVPPAAGYAIANVAERPIDDPEGVPFLPIAVAFVAFYAVALTLAAGFGAAMAAVFRRRTERSGR